MFGANIHKHYPKDIIRKNLCLLGQNQWFYTPHNQFTGMTCYPLLTVIICKKMHKAIMIVYFKTFTLGPKTEIASIRNLGSGYENYKFRKKTIVI